MVRTECTVDDSPGEVFISGSELHVTVSIRETEETYVGTSRDEEYFEEELVDERVVEVTLPVQYVYPEDSPADHVEGAEAAALLNDTSWSIVELQDIETVKFFDGQTTYLASYDSSPLQEYGYF